MTFGNQVLWLVMFAMVFCYAIENTGLLPIIAKKMLNIKIARKGPWSLALVFMLTACVTGFLTTNALTVIVILWKIFEEMVDELNISHDHPYVSGVLIMIVIAGTAGSIIAPYTGFVVMSFGFYRSMVPIGPEINTLFYFICMLIINIAFYIAFIIVFKFILKINFSFDKIRRYEKNELKLNKRQKITLLYVLILAVAMMVPHLLPQGNILRVVLLEKLGSLGVMIVVTVFMAVTAKDKETFLDMTKGFKKGIPWGLFLMVGTSLTAATALADDSTGVTEAIIQILEPLLSRISLHLLLVILTIISFLLTNILNNNACLAVFAPISIVLVQKASGNPQVIVVLLALSAMLGYLLPASSAMGALMHGHKWLDSKKIYRYGTITMGIIIVVFILVAVPLVSFLFN